MKADEKKLRKNQPKRRFVADSENTSKGKQNNSGKRAVKQVNDFIKGKGSK